MRVEGTDEPVAGATVDVMIADSGQGHRGDNRTALSGADGRYTVDLTPGSARSWTLITPVGYWAPRDSQKSEEFVVSQGRAGLPQRITWFAGAPSGISHHPRPRSEAPPGGGHGFRRSARSSAALWTTQAVSA